MLERAFSVRERGLGIPEHPQRPGAVDQGRNSVVVAKPCRHRSMCGWIIKGDRAIKVSSALRDLSGRQQGKTHHAMSDHERDCRPLLFGKRHETRCKFAHHIAVESDIARSPRPVEDREHRQRVLGSFTQRFSVLDEHTRLLRRRLRLRRGIALDVHQSVCERDLKLDLLTAQRGRGRQSGNLIEGARELLYCFDQRRLRQRPQSRFAPKVCGFLDHAGLCPMARQQLRSALSAFREVALDGFGDAGMQCASRLAQQRPVSCVLHEGMLEQVGCMRGHASSEQQTSRDETVQR